MSENDRIKLLMNSKAIREFRDSLLEGMLFDFDFMGRRVSVWNSFPFFVVTKNTKGKKLLRPLDLRKLLKKET